MPERDGRKGSVENKVDGSCPEYKNILSITEWRQVDVAKSYLYFGYCKIGLNVFSLSRSVAVARADQ